MLREYARLAERENDILYAPGTKRRNQLLDTGKKVCLLALMITGQPWMDINPILRRIESLHLHSAHKLLVQISPLEPCHQPEYPKRYKMSFSTL